MRGAHGIEDFAIVDDNFVVNKAEVTDLGPHWPALSRVDTVDQPLLETMVAFGALLWDGFTEIAQTCGDPEHDRRRWRDPLETEVIGAVTARASAGPVLAKRGGHPVLETDIPGSCSARVEGPESWDKTQCLEPDTLTTRWPPSRNGTFPLRTYSTAC